MNLATHKKQVLSLIEEYSKDSQYLTEDLDIANRINEIYNVNYPKIANIAKIKKIKKYPVKAGEGKKNLEFSLPSDFQQIEEVEFLDKNNNLVDTYYRITINKIYINDKIDCTCYLTYTADVANDPITDDNEETYEIELKGEALSALAYAIAGDILKMDLASDHTVFGEEYRRILQMIDPRRNTVKNKVRIKEIEL